MDTLHLQRQAIETFNEACDRRGLSPEGFDLRVGDNGPDPTQLLILLGGREYRYSATDPAWAEKFFHEIQGEGDSGEGVEGATSEEERNS